MIIFQEQSTERRSQFLNLRADLSGNRRAPDNGSRLARWLCAALFILGFPLFLQAQFLGVTNVVEGPAAGSDSVVLVVASDSPSWTASANASWLHISTTNVAGTGSGNVVFAFDDNPGDTRVGTLTIDDLTVVVTQGGKNYVRAPSHPIQLCWGVSGSLGGIAEVVSAGNGNLYINDGAEISVMNNESATNSPAYLFEVWGPLAFAIGPSNTLYFTSQEWDQADAIVVNKWNQGDSSPTLLFESGIGTPTDLTVDGAGNVFVSSGNSVEEWNAESNALTAVNSPGLTDLVGIAADVAGNLYLADAGLNAVFKWSPSSGVMAPLFSMPSSGLLLTGLAVDGRGNVYPMTQGWTEFGTFHVIDISEWSAATGAITLVNSSSSTANAFNSVIYSGKPSVDGAGNIFATPESYGVLGYPIGGVVEIPRAFANMAPITEPITAGGATLPPILPTNADLVAPFAPGADQPWLAVSSVSNGVISYSFSSSTSNRTGNIFVLGLAVPVSQADYFVNVTTLSEPAEAGGDSVFFIVSPSVDPSWSVSCNAPWLSFANNSGSGSSPVAFAFQSNSGPPRSAVVTINGQSFVVVQTGTALSATNSYQGPAPGASSVMLATSGTWNATANAPWLHLTAGAASGIGNSVIGYSFDTNSGPTRTGTICIAGQVLTVTQAASSYVPSQTPAVAIVSGLQYPYGFAVDKCGNIWISNYGEQGNLCEWLAVNNTVTLVAGESSGLGFPGALATDGAGNVYIADIVNQAVEEWSSNQLITLASTGSLTPAAIAVNSLGDVYYAEATSAGTCLIAELDAATNFSNLLFGVVAGGLAVDVAGDVYYSDDANNCLAVNVATNNVPIRSDAAAITGSNLNSPSGLAVDGAGNVYLADTGNNSIKIWTAADNAVTTVIANAGHPFGVSVDALGNIYYGSATSQTIFEAPRAFVDMTPIYEGAAAGAGALPPVIPLNENLSAPFAPTSDQAWLSLTGVTNGVVSFRFSATTSNRTAHISLLGVSVPVSQVTEVIPPLFINSTVHANGAFEVDFTNNNANPLPFTILASTNLSLPMPQWTVRGTVSGSSPGILRFIDSPATENQCFYIIRCP